MCSAPSHSFLSLRGCDALFAVGLQLFPHQVTLIRNQSLCAALTWTRAMSRWYCSLTAPCIWSGSLYTSAAALGHSHWRWPLLPQMKHGCSSNSCHMIDTYCNRT